MVYEDGKGLPQDDRLAAELYERACAAIPLFCIDLGRLYENGRGVPMDPARAAVLYARACASDEPLDERGCTYLGRLYLAGRGVAADRARAVQLFRQGCAGGVHFGCDDLRDLGESP